MSETKKDEYRRVFLISEGEYSDYGVIAIFEDQPTAESWMEAMNKRDIEQKRYREYRVEERWMVAPKTKPKVVKTYHKYAFLSDSGKIDTTDIRVDENWACESGNVYRRPSVRYVRFQHKGASKGGRLEISGPTEKIVEKVFNDKVMAWKAGAFGGPGVTEINE